MSIRKDQEGILYIVATPIGNMEDITLRALRVLKEVDIIAAEDTRHTKKLLKIHGITTPLLSLHEHNEAEKSMFIISKIKLGKSLAYVTDAGTPGISDPGYRLVKTAHRENLRVLPVPGPSAVIAALSASGMPADNFIFHGFLPSQQNKRCRLIEEFKNEQKTIVIYESPARYLSTLRDIHAILGDNEIVIAREMTKVFEEIWRGKISLLLKKSNGARPKGEFTIILPAQKKEEPVTDDEIQRRLETIWKENPKSLRDAVSEVAKQTGLSRQIVYNLALKIRRGSAPS